MKWNRKQKKKRKDLTWAAELIFGPLPNAICAAHIPSPARAALSLGPHWPDTTRDRACRLDACSGPPGCDILSGAPWYVDHGSQSRPQRIPRMAERTRGGWPWRKSSAHMNRLTTSGDKTLVALASVHAAALRSLQLTQKEKKSRAAIAIYRRHRRLRFPSSLVLLSGVRWSRLHSAQCLAEKFCAGCHSARWISRRCWLNSLLRPAPRLEPSSALRLVRPRPYDSH
jgi:hypothetical protein